MTENKPIMEHELLYEGLDWSVGIDGMLINPKQIPYTNCLYELALACNSKSKQLARKTQECEELKENLPNAITRLMKEIDQLKTENEEYKKNGVDLFEQLSNGLKANEKLKAQNEQAKQKLEKIREICNIKQKQSVYVLESVFEQILQLIDEVEWKNY